MLDPLIKTVEVPCSQEKAFDVFVAEMGSWWPMEKFSLSVMKGGVSKGLRVEAKEGGKIVEIGPDDTEHHWGTIKSYNPHAALTMDFHVPHPTEPGPMSFVELKFTVLGEKQTRVELIQTNWEVLGKDEEFAAQVRGGYDYGWNMIFGEAYKAACS